MVNDRNKDKHFPTSSLLSRQKLSLSLTKSHRSGVGLGRLCKALLSLVSPLWVLNGTSVLAMRLVDTLILGVAY